MAKKGTLLLLLTALLFLSGCRVNAQVPSGLHIVSRVDVLYRQNDELLTRHYTAPSKMESVLNYLRLLEYAGIPDCDPELYEGDTCRITVQLSGGSSHIYYLYADRYLSRDCRPWEQVTSNRSLLSLLQLLPDDL